MADGEDFTDLQPVAQSAAGGSNASAALPVSKAQAPVSSNEAIHTTVSLTPVKNRGSSGIDAGEDEMLPSAEDIDSALAGQSPMPVPISKLLESSVFWRLGEEVVSDSDSGSGSELDSTD
eukprot:5361171-Pleurochrysis_carterae.AAC.1